MKFKEGQIVLGTGKCSKGRAFLIKSAKDGFYAIEDVKTFEKYPAFSKEFDPFFEVAGAAKEGVCVYEVIGEGVCPSCTYSNLRKAA